MNKKLNYHAHTHTQTGVHAIDKFHQRVFLVLFKYFIGRAGFIPEAYSWKIKKMHRTQRLRENEMFERANLEDCEQGTGKRYRNVEEITFIDARITRRDDSQLLSPLIFSEPTASQFARRKSIHLESSARVSPLINAGKRSIFPSIICRESYSPVRIKFISIPIFPPSSPLPPPVFMKTDFAPRRCWIRIFLTKFPFNRNHGRYFFYFVCRENVTTIYSLPQQQRVVITITGVRQWIAAAVFTAVRVPFFRYTL